MRTFAPCSPLPGRRGYRTRARSSAGDLPDDFANWARASDRRSGLSEEVAHGCRQVREHQRAQDGRLVVHASGVEAAALAPERDDLASARVDEPVLANAVALVDSLLLAAIARRRRRRQHLDDEVGD